MLLFFHFLFKMQSDIVEISYKFCCTQNQVNFSSRLHFVEVCPFPRNKSHLQLRDHPYSTFAKFSKKLTPPPPPWYSHICTFQLGWQKRGAQILWIRILWGWNWILWLEFQFCVWNSLRFEFVRSNWIWLFIWISCFTIFFTFFWNSSFQRVSLNLDLCKKFSGI